MQRAAAIWFAPVLIGQFIFVAYIFYAYGAPLLSGNLTEWNSHLSEAWVAGRTGGNMAVLAHLILAIVIHIGGPLQLVPAVRNHFPRFHRWTGRTFVLGVLIAIVTGTYMSIVRGIGEWTLWAGFGLQSVLILVFTTFALRAALRRDFKQHMRWATRLFLAASAIWFLRVMVMIWFVLTGGIGIDQSNGTGWFLDIMAFGQFLPLVIYEIYNALKTRGPDWARYAMAVFLFIAAGLTATGVGLATLGMWFPVLG